MLQQLHGVTMYSHDEHHTNAPYCWSERGKGASAAKPIHCCPADDYTSVHQSVCQSVLSPTFLVAVGSTLTCKTREVGLISSRGHVISTRTYTLNNCPNVSIFSLLCSSVFGLSRMCRYIKSALWVALSRQTQRCTFSDSELFRDAAIQKYFYDGGFKRTMDDLNGSPIQKGSFKIWCNCQ